MLYKTQDKQVSAAHIQNTFCRSHTQLIKITNTIQINAKNIILSFLLKLTAFLKKATNALKNK